MFIFVRSGEVERNLVRLETSCTVFLSPMVSVLCSSHKNKCKARQVGSKREPLYLFCALYFRQSFKVIQHIEYLGRLTLSLSLCVYVCFISMFKAHREDCDCNFHGNFQSRILTTITKMIFLVVVVDDDVDDFKVNHFLIIMDCSPASACGFPAFHQSRESML